MKKRLVALILTLVLLLGLNIIVYAFDDPPQPPIIKSAPLCPLDFPPMHSICCCENDDDQGEDDDENEQ